MIVYKVFSRNDEFKNEEFLGVLVERRKESRVKNLFESGSKWAKLTFGPLGRENQAIFVVPDELHFGHDAKLLMEKRIFTRDEFLEMVRGMVGEIQN